MAIPGRPAGVRRAGQLARQALGRSMPGSAPALADGIRTGAEGRSAGTGIFHGQRQRQSA